MAVESVVTLDRFKSFVSPTKYVNASVKTLGSNTAEIRAVYPFRVRFKDLGYPGYSSSNVPPIGIAVIGSTFYIL